MFAIPVKPPATAAPTINDGIARAGSDAPNGIDPSVMNESPITMFVKPALRSSLVNLFLNKITATVVASGGTIPPAITAAIVTEPPVETVAAKVPVAKI